MDHIQSLARRFQNALQFSFFLLAQGTQGVFLWLSHGFAPFLSPCIVPPSCLNHLSITSQSFHCQRAMQLRVGPLVYSWHTRKNLRDNLIINCTQALGYLLCGKSSSTLS